MPDYVAITRQNHGARRWNRPQGYRFAMAQTVVPLVFRELPLTMVTLPVAFIAQGDDYGLMALLGLRAGENLLVAPDGNWLAPYVPAALRVWPFALAPTEAGQEALCIDQESGLVVAEEVEGSHPFFAEDGQPSKELADIVSFVQQVTADGKATQGLCAMLKEHGLIEPWPLTLPGASQPLTGLHRINEAALNALPGDTLAKVRDGGGLAVAYGQLLSMNQVPLLLRLVEARLAQAAGPQGARANPPGTPGGGSTFQFLSDSPTVDLTKVS